MLLNKTNCDLEDLHLLVKKIKDKLFNRIIFLKGDLGAGKTTLVNFFVNETGLSEHSSSPTFTLLQIYGNEENKIFHYDLYRLNHFEELDNIGFFEQIEEKGTFFIEWADKFNLKKYLENIVEINIEIADENKRNIIIKNL